MQIIVVIIPGLADIFKLVPLNKIQWLYTIGISILPIVIVELQKKLNEIKFGKVVYNKYEENQKTTLDDVLLYYKDHEPRGEYVLVVSGKDRRELEEQEKKAWEELSFSEHMAIYEAQEIPRKEAMKLVAKDRGISKRDVYQALLSEES